MSDNEVKTFFEDQTIFITGGTGFLGKVLIEKLLRTCSVRRIYVLVRPKKAQSAQERIDNFFTYPCFDRLKKEKSNFEHVLTFVEGDCERVSLGIDPEMEEVLIEETNVVIHAAANVRFEQSLREAANINVRSTGDVLGLAKKMALLKAVVYVSTAFSNAPRRHIDEEFYEPPMTAKQIMTIINEVDDQILDRITSELIAPWPNTYTYTKSVAEDFIKTEGRSLPVAIVRPGIVGPTMEEPMPGWIENFYGIGGIICGAALGVIRSINGKLDNAAMLVPCDYVSNTILASVWDAAKNRRDVRIYNCTGSNKNIITWGGVNRCLTPYYWIYPTAKMVWYYSYTMRENALWHKICVFFQHTLVAYVADFFLVCIGREAIAVKNYERIDKMLNFISYFTMNNWTFNNDNVEKLWENVGNSDKRNFPFNMQGIDWNSFGEVGLLGGRKYLLKDPPETVPRAKRNLWIFFIIHLFFKAMFYFLLFLFFQLIVRCII